MTERGDNPYLRNAVLTASPEQLQLMLYDGAIRFATQAADAIAAGEVENSYNLLTRAQRIVREMENGLRHDVAPELCGRMAALYRFVFSKLVDANINKDPQALADALKILTHQRETWAILVQKVQRAHSEDLHQPVSTASARDPAAPDSISLEG